MKQSSAKHGEGPSCLVHTRVRSDRCAGFTFIEVAVVTAISTILIGAFFFVLYGSHSLFERQMQQHSVDQIGRAGINRVCEIIRAVEPSTVLPTVMENSPYVEFQTVEGYENGAPKLSAVTRLVWEAGDGEELNDLDDDQDGRVDEGFLAFYQSGKLLHNLIGNVTGVRFTTTGAGVAVEIDIAVVDARGELIERTFSRTITFRN